MRAVVAFLLALIAPAAAMLVFPLYFDSNWFIAAITGRLFLLCWIIFFASAACFLLVISALLRLGVPLRKTFRLANQQGAAIVEFALAMPFLLLLSMLMAQSALLMAGNLCVHYAAFCAARSAIVTVPLSLSDDEPTNVLAASSNSAKLNRIKQAAVWAVTPVSCASELYTPAQAESLQQGLAGIFSQSGQAVPGWISSSLLRRLAYAMDHTEVRIDDPAAGGATYTEHEDIVVHVDHTYYLSIPYINRLFMKLDSNNGRELDFSEGQYGLVISAQCRLPNEGVQDYVDVEKFADAQ